MNTKIKEALFYITHPIKSLEAKVRQDRVALEIAGPPAGSTIEEFPLLSIFQAAALLYEAGEKDTNQVGGVQLEDWSNADQERMLRGERPRGYPIHKHM